MTGRPLLAAVCLCTPLALSALVGAHVTDQSQPAAQNQARSLSPQTRQRLTDSLNKAAAYLRQQRKPDGKWEDHPGITGLAALALMNMPGADPAAIRTELKPSLDWIASLAKPDGGIYDKTTPHYVTAISVMTLVTAGRPQDKAIIEKARAFIAERMLDEGEGVKRDEIWYGGMGYGASRPDGRQADIISLEYAVRALKESGLPSDNAAYEKAITFLQRTQNNSETNTQKWAANDGGFVYYPGFTYHADGGTKSYGSATYAGVLSYTWANVKKTDPRVQAVLKWVRDNYTVDENPGMGQKTVYYYYMVFAKALEAVGEPVIVDSKGRSHVWREDLGRKLVSLQHPEGYWVNEVKDEMQDNKVLVTTFTMSAIQAILK
jgi:squalene-hopene/tetraprenyl-beta-curcumene cyclase